jgi:hypothetical protein
MGKAEPGEDLPNQTDPPGTRGQISRNPRLEYITRGIFSGTRRPRSEPVCSRIVRRRAQLGLEPFFRLRLSMSQSTMSAGSGASFLSGVFALASAEVGGGAAVPVSGWTGGEISLAGAADGAGGGAGGAAGTSGFETAL